MYTIVMDCMGSDKGPSVLSEGILRFVKEYQDVKIVAVGRKEDLKTLGLSKYVQDLIFEGVNIE